MSSTLACCLGDCCSDQDQPLLKKPSVIDFCCFTRTVYRVNSVDHSARQRQRQRQRLRNNKNNINGDVNRRKALKRSQSTAVAAEERVIIVRDGYYNSNNPAYYKRR